MATLAPKLPYTHPFAGGFPYRGSQRLPSDPDALTYLAAVAAADGAPVETAVAVAVDDFFKGCKADPSGTPGRSNWDAIKASCILCGARTLAGALVPLVGTAPSNVADGFVEGDYTRGGATPGLQGDGTSYLDSGVANNSDFGGTVADPQNDQHIAVYATVAGTTGALFGAETGSSVGATHLAFTGAGLFARNRSTGADVVAGAASQTKLLSFSRGSSANYQYRFGSLSGSFSRASQTPSALNVFVFERSGGVASPPTDARLAFYSIGTAISDLAALDARVTALVTAIGAAI